MDTFFPKYSYDDFIANVSSIWVARDEIFVTKPLEYEIGKKKAGNYVNGSVSSNMLRELVLKRGTREEHSCVPPDDSTTFTSE